MLVKTFEAINYKDAIRAIKRELGPDAVILSTKEKVLDGDPKNTKIIEVTAASSEKPRTLTGGSTQAQGDLSDALEQRLQSVETRLMHMHELMASKRELQNLQASLGELKVLLLDTLRSSTGSLTKDLPLEIAQIERQLRIAGVDSTHIGRLVEHLSAVAPQGSTDAEGSQSYSDNLQTEAIKWMLKRIKVSPRWVPTKGSTAVHVLVGPPGSGKTSTAAKLAAHFTLKEKCKVLLVSFDNMRLAASEQLRVYAKIIGAQFALVEQPSELPQRILDYRETDIVIVDTAGRGVKNPTHLKELELLHKLEIPTDFHLVLPATEREDQLNRAVQHFSSAGIQSLIFSKLDETWSFGEVFNIAAKWSLPLSYFSTGQDIPEDIERASRDRVVERIFGV